MAQFSYPQLMTVTSLASAAAAAIFINPAGTTTLISTILIHNTSAGTRNVTLYNVPNSGGLPGTAVITNEIAKLSIQSQDTVFIEPSAPIVLANQGDAIFGITDALYVNAQILGAQYS